MFVVCGGCDADRCLDVYAVAFIQCVNTRRLLVGVGGAFCFIACIKIGNQYFSPKRLPLITGVIYAVAMAGGFFGLGIIAYLFHHLSVNGVLFLNVLVWVLLFCIVLFVKSANGVSLNRFAQSLVYLKTVLLSWKTSVTEFCVASVNTSVYILASLWGATYLSYFHHYSTPKANFIISFIYIGVIVSSTFMGFLDSKVKSRHLFLGVCSLLTFVVLLILLFFKVDAEWFYVLVCFLFGFFSSYQLIGSPQMIALHSDNPAVTASVLSFFSLFFVFVFENVYSIMLANTWAFDRAAWVLICLMLISMVSALFIRRPAETLDTASNKGLLSEKSPSAPYVSKKPVSSCSLCGARYHLAWIRYGRSLD